MGTLKQLQESVTKLIAEVDSLKSYKQVTSWDQRAQALIDEVGHHIQAREVARMEQTQRASEAQRVHEQKPLLKRMLTSSKEMSIALAQAKQASEDQAALLKLVDQLEEKVAFTPNDPTEQKELIAHLRDTKRELQLQKKELAANVREINLNYRQKAAKLTRKEQLRWTRWERERALRPNETAQASLERQLLLVERMILWAQRFRDSE